MTRCHVSDKSHPAAQDSLHHPRQRGARPLVRCGSRRARRRSAATPPSGLGGPASDKRAWRLRLRGTKDAHSMYHVFQLARGRSPHSIIAQKIHVGKSYSNRLLDHSHIEARASCRARANDDGRTRSFLDDNHGALLFLSPSEGAPNPSSSWRLLML
jgi:hypothetical protein